MNDEVTPVVTTTTTPDMGTPSVPAGTTEEVPTHETVFQSVVAYIESLGVSKELEHAKAHVLNALHWVKQHV